MHFKVLGPLQVIGDGEFLSLGSPQQQKLIAVLVASRNSPVTTDVLIDEIWGDEPPRTARHLIHVYVSRLRSILEDTDNQPRIERTGNSYTVRLHEGELDSDDLSVLSEKGNDVRATDPVTAAHLLTEATDLWRGQPFGDLADESDLLRTESVRLTEMYLKAMSDRIDLDLELGRHAALVGELELLTTDHPYRERFWAQQMLALYRSGRQSDALRAYQDVRTTLVDEMGIEPGAELSQLELQILLHDPQLEWEAVPPSNLPHPLTSMIGREHEIGEILQVIEAARLVTLTGLGGIGKTRLALAVAEHIRSDFPDGTWWIDLSPINDPEGVVAAIADAVGIMPQPGTPLIESIAMSLASKAVLVVIDNCEHVVDGARDVATTLLAAAPGLRVMATSRMPLRATGEHVWSVPPMTVEHADAAPPDAILLFADRAMAADHRFALSSENEQIVAAICENVEGIPLAIEMAAARTRVLAPNQVLSVLTDPLRTLGSPDVDGDQRHTTLETALDRSYDLLEPDVRQVFDRLSVFPGTCDIEGVEAVACRPPVTTSALASITELTEASLVSVSGLDGRIARYRLLAIVREYGLSHLEERGEKATTRDAHARYVFDIVRRAGDVVASPEFADWIPRLDAIAPDIAAALDWALPRWPRPETLRAAPGLFEYWYRTGNPTDADKWGRAMAADIDGVPDRLVAAARQCIGFSAMVLGDPERSRSEMDAAVALLRTAEERHPLINALFGRGNAAIQTGDFATARDCATEALALCEGSGDVWLRAGPLSLLSFALVFSGGSLDDARRFSEEAQMLFRELGDTASQIVMNPLSVIAVRQGDLSSAERYALDAATVAVGSGWEATALVNLAEVFIAQKRLDKASATLRHGVSCALDAGLENWLRIGLRDLAQIAVSRDDARRAALLVGASKRNMPHYGRDPVIYGPIEEYCRAAMGEERFELASQEGHRMGYRGLMTLTLDDSETSVRAP